MKPFSPREELDYVLRYWWLIALAAILGGAAGWLVHILRPPVYEARAVFAISIDFPGDYQLSQFEEDHAVGVAMTVITSAPVMEQVVREAQAQGILIDAPALSSKAKLERRQAEWTLIIRDVNPETAAILANLFAERGLEALVEAHRHALQARSLQAYVDGLEACLPAVEGSDAEEGAQEAPEEVAQSELCSQLTPEEIRAELQSLNNELHLELLSGQGVLASTVFSLTQTASPPAAPAQFGRNTLVFAGGMIGFILGVAAVNLRLSERLAEYRKRT